MDSSYLMILHPPLYSRSTRGLQLQPQLQLERTTCFILRHTPRDLQQPKFLNSGCQRLPQKVKLSLPMHRSKVFFFFFLLCTFHNIFKLDTICVPIPAQVPVEKIPKTAVKRAFLEENHCRGYLIGTLCFFLWRGAPSIVHLQQILK